MFIVEGYWSQNNKLVYREIIYDNRLLPKYQAIEAIQYTDGTILDIKVYPNGDISQKLGYKELVDKIINQNLTGYIKVTNIK